MALMIGVLLALAVGAFGTVVGFDRERGFYPLVTVVVASYSVLFAVIGGDTQVLVVELAVASVFVVAAVLGFKRSLWIAVAALAAHGVFDLVHAHVVTNAGMPAWWPAFCGGYDVLAAVYLGWLLLRGPLSASADAR